jgi:hypothetical protein
VAVRSVPVNRTEPSDDRRVLADRSDHSRAAPTVLKERARAPETDFERRFAWWIASGWREHAVLAVLTVAWLAILDLAAHLSLTGVSKLSAVDVAWACLAIGVGVAVDWIAISAVARVIRWLARGEAGRPGPARPIAALAWVVTRLLGIIMYVLLALSRPRAPAGR